METRTIVFLFLVFKLLIKYNMYDQQEWLHNKNSHWCHSNFPNMHAKLRQNNFHGHNNLESRKTWKIGEENENSTVLTMLHSLDVKHIDVKKIE